jgi:hypothetical protein
LPAKASDMQHTIFMVFIVNPPWKPLFRPARIPARHHYNGRGARFIPSAPTKDST